METITGLALLCGPLIGGVFQIIGDKTVIGGYPLPFYFVALFQLIIIPLLICGVKVEVMHYNKSIFREIK